MGVLLWRGFDYDEVMAQCLGNCEDACTKGKQMPVVSSIRSDAPLALIFSICSTLGLESTIFIRSRRL